MKRISLLLFATLAFAAAGLAQQAMPTPVDPNVRIGKLDNGLTYFIRHNEKPDQRANFYIAQKVGSILEEENQRGLAHFLEHMAFNGTKNFPGKALLNYMEHNGVKFGENVNAWTSIEQTVYMLTNVPTTNANFIDSCLLVLHDWSSFISLEGEEIEKERGVILEEMRQGQNAQMRMWDVMLPEVYPNSPYGARLPIGTEEVVGHFDHQALRDYYHKWYRPDLQGIIIIGDIDVNAIEARIKEMFADIPAPVNPAERTRFQVADNTEPIVSIASDVEATDYEIQIFYKHDVTPTEEKNDIQYWLTTYVNDIISEMYNNRMSELTLKANPPFVYGAGYYGTFFVSDTKDAWTSYAISKDVDGIDEAINALVTENNKMRQFGFTESEYARAKADYLKRIESQYEERNKQDNGKYLYPTLFHFLNNEPMMGIENEYNLLQQIVPSLPLEAINQYSQQFISDTNMVITLTAPKKEGETLPTKTELLSMVEKANAQEVEAYVETVSDEPLIATLPKAGKVVSEKKLDEFDATEWTLKNGVKVIIKPTHFKDDEILMSAYSFGGNSTMPLDDPYTLQEINSLITIGGLGNFSAIDLPKVLAGKKAYVNPYIGNYTEGFSGSCSAKDLETMMQLIYLNFTAPRADEEAFQSYLTRTKASAANVEADPMTTFRDSLYSVMYNNHPLVKRMKAEDYDKVDYAKALKIYQERFKDPNNFVFTFVGNIDPQTFKPLVELYLGSLKAQKNKETWKDNGLNLSQQDNICHYEKEMTSPKSTVYMIFNGKMDYTPENIVYMDVLSDILDIVYTEKIREDEGGTYGVGVNGNVSLRPEGSYNLLVGFETNKEMHEKLLGIAKAELENIAKVGPRPQDLKKVQEYKVKKNAEDLENNRFWMSNIEASQRDGINKIKDFETIVNSITVQSMADFTKKVLNGYKKEIIQNPKM
jgi:Predicted Zn-dependent peptidases